MSARDAARAIAAGRVLVGGAFLVAPALAGRGWIGADAARPGVQAIFRALGVRDLILGLMALHSVDSELAPGIVATCAAADGVDFAATLAARDSLPPVAAAGALAMAGGAALAGAGLAVALRD